MQDNIIPALVVAYDGPRPSTRRYTLYPLNAALDLACHGYTRVAVYADPSCRKPVFGWQETR